MRRLALVLSLSGMSTLGTVAGHDVMAFYIPEPSARFTASDSVAVAFWDRSWSWCEDYVNVAWSEEPEQPRRSELEIANLEPSNWTPVDGGGGSMRCFGAWGSYEAISVGWPARCAKASRFQLWNDRAPLERGWNVVTLPRFLLPSQNRYGDPSPEQISIPTVPIWTGLAADIVIHAALWMLPIIAVGAWRRRKLRRGGCGTCGYDLQATPSSSPCPECGNPR